MLLVKQVKKNCALRETGVLQLLFVLIPCSLRRENDKNDYISFVLALHRAAHEDNVQACRILLSYNVDPGIVSLQGYTAAQVATENVNKILQNTKPCNICLQIEVTPEILIAVHYVHCN